MEDKDRANSASRPPFWFLSVPHMIPVNLVQVKKQEELGGGVGEGTQVSCRLLALSTQSSPTPGPT